MDIEDTAEYCRRLETYLCRKNEGHLIRLVGPAFERVCGWAKRGIPLTVAYGGIDRYFERYYAKSTRRRPVRIEFCDADVLDAFDEWRRATGIARESPDATGAEGELPAPKRDSLPRHLERAIARLTAIRAGEDRSLDPAIDDIVRELDVARGRAAALRGSPRETLLARLRELDASLLHAARLRCDDGALQQLVSEADDQLAAFKDRMVPESYVHAHQACVDRLIRERAGLPILAFD